MNDRDSAWARRIARAAQLVIEAIVTKGGSLLARAKAWLIPVLAVVLACVVGIGMLVMLATSVVTDEAEQDSSAGQCAPGQLAASSSDLVTLYVAAAEGENLGAWGPSVLASINRIETRFGRNVAESDAGAVGWMQFMPATWDRYGVDADGDGVADPNSAADAISSAANYLDALREQAIKGGVDGDEAIWRKAIWGYNHSDAYVDEVWTYAQRYKNAGRVVTDDGEVLGSFDDGNVQLASAAAPSAGQTVAATVYGGPDDPSSGPQGYKGDELAGTDSYAELGGREEADADLLGGLPYMTPLLITNLETGESLTAYKRDFGYGQGEKTLDGHRYAIDLWHETAEKLGIEGSALVDVRRLDTTTTVSAECCPDESGEAVPAALDTATEGGRPALAWPTETQEVSSVFGPRWGRMHEGIDIPAAEGTPIHAAAAGRVVQAEWFGGYGNFTCIQHSQALATCYGHQTRFAVREDQVVERGQVIGYVGNTGASRGAHLHFEVRQGQGFAGEAVDPMPWLENAEAPETTKVAGTCGDAIEASGGLRERIVQIAVDEIGEGERSPEGELSPGTNRTKYGPVGAWCAMFTTWVWERAGIPEVRNGDNYCVSKLTNWAKQRGLWQPGAAASNAQPGDMVVFNYPNESGESACGDGTTAWHIALVEKVLDDGTITTINGNGSDSMVSRRGPVDPATEADQLGPGKIIGYIKPPAQGSGEGQPA